MRGDPRGYEYEGRASELRVCGESPGVTSVCGRPWRYEYEGRRFILSHSESCACFEELCWLFISLHCEVRIGFSYPQSNVLFSHHAQNPETLLSVTMALEENR